MAWYKLYSRTHKQCIIANSLKVNDNSNQVEKSLDALNTVNNEQNDENRQTDNKEATSVANKLIMQLNFFKFENSTNVTNLNNKINEFNEKNILCGLAASYHETDDSFISDLVRKYYIYYEFF